MHLIKHESINMKLSEEEKVAEMGEVTYIIQRSNRTKASTTRKCSLGY